MLSFVFRLLSSLTLFLCLLSLSPCVVVVVVVVVARCCCCCGCDTLKNLVCPSKTSLCGRSKRPRVCQHHAHTCFNMCAWCRHARRHFGRTHGDVLDGHTGVLNGHTTPPQHHDNAHNHDHQQHFSSPKFAHVWSSGASEVHQSKHWILHTLQLENRSRTTRCRFLQSFALLEGNKLSGM